MAIKNKFIHFKTKAGFLNKLAEYVTYNEINNTYTVKSGKTDDWNMFKNYTCFIKETHEIWTHEQFYTCSITSNNITSALGYTPANSEDIPIALPNPFLLTINGTKYSGNETVQIDTPQYLKYAKLDQGTVSSGISAGNIYYCTNSGLSISTYKDFSLTNPDAIIYSVFPITFSGSCIKMKGLSDLSGNYFIYALSWMPSSSSAGIVSINGAVYE